MENPAPILISVLDYLSTRYGTSDTSRDQSDLFAQATNGKKVDIIFVGEEKVMRDQQLGRLTSISLEDFHLQIIGDVGTHCPNVQTLFLQNCKLDNWEVLDELIKQLHKLTELKLYYNEVPNPIIPNFCINSRLTTINLNGLHFTWDSNLPLAKLDTLESLNLGENCISKLCPDDAFAFVSGFQNLQILHLDQNEITSFADRLPLGRLPKLSCLFVNSNKIASISFALPAGASASSESSPLFPVLTELGLMRNQLSSWECISALQSLPALHKLRILHNPFAELPVPAELIVTSDTPQPQNIPQYSTTANTNSSNIITNSNSNSMSSSSSSINSSSINNGVDALFQPGGEGYWGPAPESAEEAQAHRVRIGVLILLTQLTHINASAVTRTEKRALFRHSQQRREREERERQNSKQDINIKDINTTDINTTDINTKDIHSSDIHSSVITTETHFTSSQHTLSTQQTHTQKVYFFVLFFIYYFLFYFRSRHS